MRGILIKAGLLSMAVAILALPVGSSAEDEEDARPSASMDVAALSKYVWRGIDFSEDSLVIQPSDTV